jgi:hypothetical protein
MRTGGVAKIDGMMAALQAHAGELMPDRVKGGRSRHRKYSEAAVRSHLSGQSDRAHLYLWQSPEPKVFYCLNFPGRHGSFLTLSVPIHYFADPLRGTRRSDEFVELVRALTAVCEPAYGFGHSEADFFLGTDPRRTDSFAPELVFETYWLNVLGPAMVDGIGRDRVRSAVAPVVRELRDGTVLLMTSSNPLEYASLPSRRVQARVLAQLRDGVSEADALRRGLARSEALTPVECDWDPDLTDVLNLVLKDVSYGYLHERAARLNRYRPAVDEWLPVAEMRPADVDDVEATVDTYHGLHAELLAAHLHKKVPEVMQATAESLPQLDCYFYHENYARTVRRSVLDEDVGPAVGAYLGMVMAHRLGGVWVPRRDIAQSQIVLGDRAWLPFQRARRYFESKEAVLDHSLTKFYRVAAAHAVMSAGPSGLGADPSGQGAGSAA